MAPSRLDDLYRDKVILDHCRNPRNSTMISDPDFHGDVVNPFCGDEIHIQLNFDGSGKVKEVGFQGEGCAVNIASGSLMSDALIGLHKYEISNLKNQFVSVMTSEVMLGESFPESDLTALVSVKEFPVRIKCVLLPWSAIDDLLKV